MRGIPKSIQGWMSVFVIVVVVLFVVARVPQVRTLIGI